MTVFPLTAYLPTIIFSSLKGTKLANIKSQKKRNRQNEKLRQKNSQVRSAIRTLSKRVLSSIDSKENAETLLSLRNTFIKTVDKAASSGIIHKNTAARKISRLTRKVNTAMQNLS